MKIYELKAPSRIWEKFPVEIDYIIYNYGFLAGGAIRSILMNETICDWDIFFENKDGRDKAFTYLIEGGYEVVFQCPIGELTTLKDKEGNKIQLITKFFKTPQETISQFDLSPACFAAKNDTLYVLQQTLKDYRKKRMSIVHLSYPVATLNRIVKYAKKGYSTHNVSKQFVESIIDTISSSLAGVTNIEEQLYTKDGRDISLKDLIEIDINTQLYID